MDRTYEQTLASAEHLSPDDQMRLAESLYVGLREDEHLAAWLDEAERRLADVKAGRSKLYDAADVLREARALIAS